MMATTMVTPSPMEAMVFLLLCNQRSSHLPVRTAFTRGLAGPLVCSKVAQYLLVAPEVAATSAAAAAMAATASVSATATAESAMAATAMLIAFNTYLNLGSRVYLRYKSGGEGLTYFIVGTFAHITDSEDDVHETILILTDVTEYTNSPHGRKSLSNQVMQLYASKVREHFDICQHYYEMVAHSNRSHLPHL